VINSLFPDLAAEGAAVQNIPGLNLHSERVKANKDKKVLIYFELLAPYDPRKELLILSPGGPGGDHQILHGLGADIGKKTSLLSRFNIIAMDHRGLGCSQMVAPGEMPPLAHLMRFAASDIEAIRLQLGAPEISILGGSYGSMLAQTYALLYPQSLSRLFLRGAVSSSEQMNNWDDTLLRFLNENAKVSQVVADLRAFDSRLADLFLDKAFTSFYRYGGRFIETPKFADEIQSLLKSGDKESIRSKLEIPPTDVSYPMQRAIMCIELFQIPPDDGAWHVQRELKYSCGEFKGMYEYFDYRSQLSLLPTRTLIWGGRYDVVTPAVAMEYLHAKVPSSYLYLDSHLGHTPTEKLACYLTFIEAFLQDEGNVRYQQIGSSEMCAGAPTATAPLRSDEIFLNL
jgi:pimeloyl-ACP methyl ester carboxylesterase